MPQRPTDPSAPDRRRDPAAESGVPAGADTPTGTQSISTPPSDPRPEPTGHYGPGYGDTTQVDPDAAPRERRDKDSR